MESYVVTLGIDFADGGRVIHELFRGTSCECVNWMYRISAPSHDMRHIADWWLQCGRASDWEAFVFSPSSSRDLDRAQMRGPFSGTAK